MSSTNLYKPNHLSINKIVVTLYICFHVSRNYDYHFQQALKVRRLITDDFQKVFNSGVDVLLTPTTISDAIRYRDFASVDHREQNEKQDVMTQPVNMAGKCKQAWQFSCFRIISVFLWSNLHVFIHFQPFSGFFNNILLPVNMADECDQWWMQPFKRGPSYRRSIM